MTQGSTPHRTEAALAAGAPWFLAALIAAEAGWLQMMQAGQMGVICGAQASLGHCAACYAAAAMLAAGTLAMISERRRLSEQPARGLAA